MISLLGPSLGEMDADGRDAARDVIQESVRASSEELQRLQQSMSVNNEPLDAYFAAREADLLRSAVLWRTVAEALERGSYWLGTDYPATLPGRASVDYQAMSVTHAGKPATAVFVLGGVGPGKDLADVAEYFERQHTFLMHEAARVFNGKSDEERRRLFDSYLAATANGDHDQLGTELARIFPSGVWVDERTLLMHVRGVR